MGAVRSHWWDVTMNDKHFPRPKGILRTHYRKIVIACADFQRFISLFSILAQNHYGKMMFYGFLKGSW